MKNYYRSLRNELISAFSRKEFSSLVKIHEENAGLHFLMTIHAEKANRSLPHIMKRLREKKIKIPRLADFYYTPIPPEKENVFVLNYSGIQKNAISEIVETICGILAQ